MQIFTKKYGGDPMRTYKVLMRKLSKEGYFQELKERQFFKSKSQKRRETEEQGTIRTKKKLRIIQEIQAKELPIRKAHKNKPPQQKK